MTCFVGPKSITWPPMFTFHVGRCHSHAHSWSDFQHGSSTVLESVICGMMTSAGPKTLWATCAPGSWAGSEDAKVTTAAAAPRTSERYLIDAEILARAAWRGRRMRRG